MQDFHTLYTQDYLATINRYVREKAKQGLKKLSQNELVVLDEYKTIIDDAASMQDCCAAIKNKGSDLKESKLLFVLFETLQSAADQFYIDENLFPNRANHESEQEKLQRLKKELHKKIDFYLIQRAAKNKPEQISTLRTLIVSDTESEEERIAKLENYLNSLWGKSRLKSYLKETIKAVRGRHYKDLLNQNERLHFENTGHRTLVNALKHLIQYERKKHHDDLKIEQEKHEKTLMAEKKQHAAELFKMQQCLTDKENNIQKLERKIAVQDKRIDQQQIKINALCLQMQTMITSMQQLQCFMPKNQQKVHTSDCPPMSYCR